MAININIVNKLKKDMNNYFITTIIDKEIF